MSMGATPTTRPAFITAIEPALIYGKEAMPLLERYKAAVAAEAAAISSLHGALQRGIKDRDILDTLTQRMTDTHAASMDLLDALQQFRLD